MPQGSFGHVTLNQDDVTALRAARAKAKSRFTVGPFFPVQGHARAFQPGEPIDFDDLPATRVLPATDIMRDLVRSSHVIELTEEELRAAECPPDARYIAVRALSSTSGILAPGAQVTPDDVPGGLAQIQQLVARGYVADRKAPVPYPDDDFGPEASLE